VLGLQKEQFRVSEDNTPQDIAYFSKEDLPLQVGILLDATGTVKDELKAKVLPGFTNAGRKEDEYFLVESGKTPLNDAVLETINTLDQRGSNKKRALILVTTRSAPSSAPFSKIRDRLRELDIQLYVTGFSDSSTDDDRQALRELAEQTGGSAFFSTSIFEQADICKKIAAQLKNQYVIGYRSTNKATDAKWRKIKITGEYLDSQSRKIRKMNVHAKPGYFAPAPPK
jgi:Ca-activated chloride channel family protein